jgi:hypothetical protein
MLYPITFMSKFFKLKVRSVGLRRESSTVIVPLTLGFSMPIARRKGVPSTLVQVSEVAPQARARRKRPP